MNSKLSMLKSIAVIAALVAGGSGIARADNDMNPYNGESYEYFKDAQANASKAPSTFHQTHPHGLSNAEIESMSSESPMYQLPNESATSEFRLATAPSEWREDHPRGPTYAEIEASSSASPMWKVPLMATNPVPPTVATAPPEDPSVRISQK